MEQMKRKRKPKMNKEEVQEIYDKVNTTRSIFAVDVLGLKACLYHDLFGSLSVERMSDTDLYFLVKQKLKDLCDYALNAKPEPVAKDFDALEGVASALRALQDTLQDVFSKLETALESITEAQKD
nr:MAG TPA: hypothetical protein [Caudoviricetes sp.]